MSRNVDSAGGPASPASMTGAPGSSDVSDNQYEKANRKGEIKIDKLDSTNYQTWAKGMEILLSAKEMWDLVIGDEKMPGAMRPNDRAAWRKDDRQAKAWIYVNVENDQRSHIEDAATANEMWMTLKKIHGATNRSRLNLLLKRFSTYKAGPDESIDSICSNLARLHKTIREINKDEAPSDLNMALALTGSIDDDAYVTAKYRLEDEENLMLGKPQLLVRKEPHTSQH